MEIEKLTIQEELMIISHMIEKEELQFIMLSIMLSGGYSPIVDAGILDGKVTVEI